MGKGLKGNTTVLEALQELRLSLIQQVVLLHLIHASRPVTFTELLKVTGSAPETLTTQIQELYRAGYVRCRSPRGAADPVYEFISTTANQEDVKAQTSQR